MSREVYKYFLYPKQFALQINYLTNQLHQSRAGLASDAPENCRNYLTNTA
jgi:hypothetical protein